MGICSGAINSFNVACCDRRVVGAVLINPLDYSKEFHASVDEFHALVKARRYWKTCLFNPKGWIRAITRPANYRKLNPNLRSLFIDKAEVLSVANGVASDYRVIAELGVRLLIVYSGRDRSWVDRHNMIFGYQGKEIGSPEALEVQIVQDADHTFTLLNTQDQLVELLQDWIHKKGWV